MKLKCQNSNTVEEGTQRLKESGILEWIYHVRPVTHPGRVQTIHLLSWLWEINWWGGLQSPWELCSNSFLQVRNDNGNGYHQTGIPKCNADSWIPGRWGLSGHTYCQRQGGYGCCYEQWCQNVSQNSRTHRDLWHCLVDHDVPRKVDKQSTKFWLDLCKQSSMLYN